MADQRPPRVVGGEVPTLLASLRFQRESLVRKLDGITEQQARLELVPSGTNLLWLVKHCRRAERIWFFDRFLGREHVPEDDRPTSEETIESVVADYRATWAEVDDLISATPLDEPARNVSDGLPCDLRWCVVHLVEEIARHAGHADILRELIDGEVGR